MSPVYDELKDDLSGNGLKYLVFDRCFASLFPDGDSIICYSDLDKTLSSLERHSKEDADAWNGLYNQYLKIKAPILSMMFNSFSISSLIKSGIKVGIAASLAGVLLGAYLGIKYKDKLTGLYDRIMGPDPVTDINK